MKRFCRQFCGKCADCVAARQEVERIDAAYEAAYQYDLAHAKAHPRPVDEDEEDPNDYTGMGWIGKDGRP